MKYNKSVFRSLALVSQFGFNMIAPILLCLFLGMWIDRLLHTEYWVIVLFFIGALAGGRNCYVFAKKIFMDDEEEKQREARRKHGKKNKTDK